MKKVPEKYLLDDDTEMRQLSKKRYAMMQKEVQEENAKRAKKPKKSRK